MKIESSTVKNSEKDFSKFDPIDNESHHLLGGLTDRPSWAERPCHRTLLTQKSHSRSNRSGSNELANEKSTVLTLRKNNEKKKKEK